MDFGPYLPFATAIVTLANTVLLIVLNRTANKTHEKVNGMQAQTVYEAEQRGRRLERHSDQHTDIGE